MTNTRKGLKIDWIERLRRHNIQDTIVSLNGRDLLISEWLHNAVRECSATITCNLPPREAASRAEKAVDKWFELHEPVWKEVIRRPGGSLYKWAMWHPILEHVKKGWRFTQPIKRPFRVTLRRLPASYESEEVDVLPEAQKLEFEELVEVMRDKYKPYKLWAGMFLDLDGEPVPLTLWNLHMVIDRRRFVRVWIYVKDGRGYEHHFETIKKLLAQR